MAPIDASPTLSPAQSAPGSAIDLVSRWLPTMPVTFRASGSVPVFWQRPLPILSKMGNDVVQPRSSPADCSSQRTRLNQRCAKYLTKLDLTCQLRV